MIRVRLHLYSDLGYALLLAEDSTQLHTPNLTIKATPTSKCLTCTWTTASAKIAHDVMMYVSKQVTNVGLAQSALGLRVLLLQGIKLRN